MKPLSIGAHPAGDELGYPLARARIEQARAYGVHAWDEYQLVIDDELLGKWVKRTLVQEELICTQ